MEERKTEGRKRQTGRAKDRCSEKERGKERVCVCVSLMFTLIQGHLVFTIFSFLTAS